MSQEAVMLTLIGGPTVLMEMAGHRLLTDPTFDPPGTYPGKAVDLHKTAGPAWSVHDVGRVDAVLLSHDQHADNLDHAGRAMLEAVPATYTTMAAAGRLQARTIGLRPFETVKMASGLKRDLFLTATPARHGPVGIEPISGDVIGFLVGLRSAGDAVYVTGDTVWYEGTALVAQNYSPKIVIVFAGSAEPRAAFHMTMNSNDVIATAHAFPNAKIVAVHNDSWAHFKESADDLARSFAALQLSNRIVLLEPGKPTAFALD